MLSGFQKLCVPWDHRCCPCTGFKRYDDVITPVILYNVLPYKAISHHIWNYLPYLTGNHTTKSYQLSYLLHIHFVYSSYISMLLVSVHVFCKIYKRVYISPCIWMNCSLVCHTQSNRVFVYCLLNVLPSSCLWIHWLTCCNLYQIPLLILAFSIINRCLHPNSLVHHLQIGLLALLIL